MRLTTLDPHTISRQLYICGGLCGQTQGSGVSSVTGKLLNTRPCRNVQLDGAANYVAITIHPSCSAKVIPPPLEWVLDGLAAAFTAFHRIDPAVKWFPKYDP